MKVSISLRVQNAQHESKKQNRHTTMLFSKEHKRVASENRVANMLLANIRNQLRMSEQDSGICKD